ncbi:MAG: 5'-deoxynucleotidase [Clostridia bacterium]|nr:5'-deoxynucleotidase [Clostridia bacterium]
MEESFYAYMSRLKHIRRWGLMRNTVPENVAEHSFQVAMIAHALCIIRMLLGETAVSEKDVVLAALYHETAEAITGDLPTPIKYYNEDIASAYKAIEHQAEATMMEMLPAEMRPAIAPYVAGGLDPEVRGVVKAADTICAYIKCLEEKKSGNLEFEPAAAKTLEKIKSMKRPEVDYFMDHFLDAYTKTIDELNA